jgi:hypothetical protein
MLEVVDRHHVSRPRGVDALSCLRLDWTLLMSQFIVDSSLQLASGDLGPPRSWRLP